MTSPVTPMVGGLIKILFREGTQIRALHGTLSSFSDDFIQLRTLRNDFWISRGDVVKIQQEIEGRKDDGTYGYRNSD